VICCALFYSTKSQGGQIPQKRPETEETTKLSILPSAVVATPGPSPASLQPSPLLSTILPSCLSPQNTQQLIPVGSGPLNILRFYVGSGDCATRLIKLLLTVDFVREICNILVQDAERNNLFLT
jgi:hypothetical protein